MTEPENGQEAKAVKSASLTKTVYWVDNNDEAETREAAKEALAENVKIFFSEEGGAYTQLTEGDCGKFGLKELPEIGISEGDAKTGKIDIAFKDVDWKKPDVTSGISSAEMSCTVRKFNLDGSRITYKISFDNTGVPNFGAITEAAYDGGKILLILAGTTTFTATKEWLEPADEEITRPEATFELWRYRAGQNYTSASRKLQKQLMSLPGPGRRMRHPGLIPLKAPMIQNWSAAIFKTLPAVYTNNSASGTQYIEYRIVEKSITYTLSGGEQTTVEAKVNDDPAAGTWTYAYTDDIMQPAYRKGASAYTSSDREVYNALKTTGLTVTKKWAEDEDNTYKTRPQTKQSGADWETSFLIQRKSGADGWETVKTYSGSADAPLIITLYGKNAEAQATGSVSGLPSGEYRAVELQPGYDAGKPEGSIIAPDAGEEAVYNKAYTAAYEFDPGKNATTVTNTLNTVQYGLQKKWANNDHGNIVSVTVELQYQAADDKWTSFSEVTLDGTADDAAGKSCYEDAAWHALWTAVPEYLPGSMTDKSGHTLYRIVEKAGEGYEAVAGDTATKFTEQNGLYTAELTNRRLWRKTESPGPWK